MGKGLVSVVLAAGEGTRMKSSHPKVLHKICGKPMLLYVLEALKQAGCEKNYVVVGYKAENVIEELEKYLGARESKIEFVRQKMLRGSGDAVAQTKRLLSDYSGNILVVYGDVPLLEGRTIRKLVRAHIKEKNSCTLLCATLTDPSGYGRVVEDNKGQVVRIVEERDASPVERKIKLVNGGVYCFKARDLFEAIKEIRPNNAKGEYYLTDCVQILRSMGKRIAKVIVEDAREIEGVNNRKQLVEVQQYLNRQNLERLMLAGVTITDPLSTFIDSEVRIGRDTVVYAATIIRGKTRIGKECQLGPYAFIEDSQVGDNVEVRSSFIYGARIFSGAKVGPFTHIRPGTVVGPGVRVGNFCEVKKSKIGEGSKVPHLSYIGDAFVGKNVNIGAGTITCNFDGVRKNVTVIGDGVFVGSDTQFIAPVRIGKGAVIGAGSTITEDVPSGKLAIARARQVIKERKKK